MSGAADWELEYPTIVGDSSRGGLFEPKEIAGELMMQFFGKNGNAHWEPVWVEMNGHVLHVYTQKVKKRERKCPCSDFFFFFFFFLLFRACFSSWLTLEGVCGLCIGRNSNVGHAQKQA
jgi:hypothetical protein